jgi:hypothetical protein
MITHLFHILKFKSLRKKIKKNPSLGKLDTDAAYLYREGLYALKYRIVKNALGKENVEWVSQKRYLNSFEEWIRKISKNFFKFWHYQSWLNFLKPFSVVLAVISIFIFYFGFVEARKTKIERIKWIIASVTQANPEQIEYIGDGWLQISSQRKTAVDKKEEPIKYRFNPLKLFFSGGQDSLTRWRGKPFGYATHPIVYNEFGEVWIYKGGSWQSGRVNANTINWDTPQGTGIQSDKVVRQDIVVENGKLKIKDK